MAVDHVDVLIVGAGLSGVGAACHLKEQCPDKTFTILESRSTIGGTWDLFRYPGVRSDSDMYTLGYAFRPWDSPHAIADGPAILDYVRRTAEEYDVPEQIRFGLRVVSAAWSSATARWTVTARRQGEGEAAPDPAAETVTLTCSFLWACSGYFRYDEGYAPPLSGAEDFAGRIVHPQHWPDDLDHRGARVVVIGSGATAVTLVPAMADEAEHVTMVQRSPTYIAAVPAQDALALRLHGRVPDRVAYPLVRGKNLLIGMIVYQLSRRRPERLKALLLGRAATALPPGYDVDTHLTPSYHPWDQRLCAAPGGDFFRAISSGRAEIVTDRVERLTATGVRLASGRELPADLVVTATGLNLLAIGGIVLTVDGREVTVGEEVAYKGMMLSGVPNFAFTVGYVNASWTLRADLVARYVSRLLKHLDAKGYQSVTPVEPDVGDRSRLGSLFALQSGYVRRAASVLPRQGPRFPWRLHQNYLRDGWLMRHGRLTDSVRFGYAGRTSVPQDQQEERLDEVPVR